MAGFFKYQLRTSENVDRARAFYASVLGQDDPSIVPLHEQARARGAQPHWLGFLPVADVATASAAFVVRGAVPLGPPWINSEGLEAAVVRDPGGAVVALAKQATIDGSPQPFDVGWHLLNTTLAEQAKTHYRELFGWCFKSPLDLGAHGVLHPFAWHEGGPTVGAVADIADRPGVHPHWLFAFRRPSLSAALDSVRSRGGTALGPFELPDFGLLAVCDDPQGAAFGLLESMPPSR